MISVSGERVLVYGNLHFEYQDDDAIIRALERVSAGGVWTMRKLIRYLRLARKLLAFVEETYDVLYDALLQDPPDLVAVAAVLEKAADLLGKRLGE